MGIIESTHGAKAGHPGGSLSAAELFAYLYNKEMRIDPANPKWEDRDRFVLSKSCECAKANSFWRPGLFSMLRAVRRGDVDTVAVTRLSRFARKKSKLCKILAKLQANDVTLITTDVSLRYQMHLYALDRVIAGCPKGRNRCAGIHTADA